jgi:hypothetical protein
MDTDNIDIEALADFTRRLQWLHPHYQLSIQYILLIYYRYTVKLVFPALYKIILYRYYQIIHRFRTSDETMGLSTAIHTYICRTHYTYRYTYIIIRYAGAAGIHVGKLKYHSCVITVCGLCCFVSTLQQQFLYR